MQHSDVLIVGAGPAGLSLSISLAQAGFAVTVVEQQGAQQLAAPAPDGREVSVLAVSENRFRPAPYLATALMAFGMVAHYLRPRRRDA